MRIFISQPMKDLPLEKIRKDRIAVLSKAQISGHTVIDNILNDFSRTNRGAICCLAAALQKIAQADLVVFLDGWEKARGCKIEEMVCRCYDIKHMCAGEYMGTIW